MIASVAIRVNKRFTIVNFLIVILEVFGDFLAVLKEEGGSDEGEDDAANPGEADVPLIEEGGGDWADDAG